MTVIGFRGQDASSGWLARDFEKTHPQAVELMRKSGVGDEFLTSFFDPYVKASDPYYRAVLYPWLEDQIHFKPEYTVGDIELQIASLTVAFPRGLDVDLKSIDTKIMSISAKVVLRGPDTELQHWEIGFIQTVLQFDRTLMFRTSSSSLDRFRWWLDKPCKDGPKRYRGAWFDEKAKTALGGMPYQTVTVEIRDRPGFSWMPLPGVTLESVFGGEALRTWLALRRKDGSQTKFLRMWEWHVDYTNKPENIPRYGISFDGVQMYATGAGAVLDGFSAKDMLKHESRTVRQLFISFDAMKNR